MNTAPPVLILMAGMPGAGKSTIAQAIGCEFGFPVVDKDVILSALLKEDVPEGLAQPASYQALFDLAESLSIHQGISVILDSLCAFPSTLETA
ncbi:MAG: AAA family ATPase [Thermomicrobiales bacterium]